MCGHLLKSLWQILLGSKITYQSSFWNFWLWLLLVLEVREFEKLSTAFCFCICTLDVSLVA